MAGPRTTAQRGGQNNARRRSEEVLDHRMLAGKSDKNCASNDGGDNTEGTTEPVWEDEEQDNTSLEPSLGGDRHRG